MNKDKVIKYINKFEDKVEGYLVIENRLTLSDMIEISKEVNDDGVTLAIKESLKNTFLSGKISLGQYNDFLSKLETSIEDNKIIDLNTHEFG